LPHTLNTIAFLLRKIKKYDVKNKPIVADRKCRSRSKFAKAMKYIDEHNRMHSDKRLYTAPQNTQEKTDVFKAHCKYIEIEIFFVLQPKMRVLPKCLY